MYEGVAPGADLIGYGSGAALLVLDGLGGIDYSITNQARYNIRVVNNSWGGSGAFDPDHPINVASKRAFDRGIAVVFAAGNSGPGRDTHNPYAKAPWVISVGAGTHDGDLTSFSSRGYNTTFDFEMDGETFTMVDEPTIVAPGEDIISTRTLPPVGVLSIDMDLLNLDPGHLPYYTHSSGTSMAAPHVAGVIALMLEANPSLNVTEIKEILRKTATNMTGREAFEVGAGYVNAFAAVQMAYDMAVPYGASVNNTREFNSTIDLNEESEEFEVSFGLLGLTSTSHTFEVEEGTNAIEARISALGLAGEGNLLNLVVEDPDGNIASSGIPVLFPLEIARNVLVTNPTAGTWEVRVEGLRGDDAVPLEIGLPETVNGTLTRFMAAGTTGLNDIEGHEAEDAIMVGVGQRLLDGLPDGNFKPDEKLTRMQLADYLMMGQQVRQNLPADGSSFGDVSGELNTLIAQSVTAKGAAIADTFQVADGVMLPKSGGFSPNGTVNKVDLAYSLVQSLGLQKQARSLNDEDVTVLYDGDRVTMDDQNDIPSDMRGYVQLALDFNILGAEFELTQGRFDLFPTLTAKFNPDQEVTRADFALAVTRAQEVEAGSGGSSGILSMFSKENDIESEESEKPEVVALDQNYPNPFNPSTVISYSLPEQTDVSITVYNMAGQQIQTLVNEVQSAGTYQVNFDASNLASGVYMYRLQAGSQVITKQMNFIK